eukprot:m.359894 g.359894  ORF g.359894 m.359894 type:complete len:320 (+) comp19952_c0_seq4:776-1735(+)
MVPPGTSHAAGAPHFRPGHRTSSRRQRPRGRTRSQGQSRAQWRTPLFCLQQQRGRFRHHPRGAKARRGHLEWITRPVHTNGTTRYRPAQRRHLQLTCTPAGHRWSTHNTSHDSTTSYASPSSEPRTRSWQNLKSVPSPSSGFTNGTDQSSTGSSSTTSEFLSPPSCSPSDYDSRYGHNHQDPPADTAINLLATRQTHCPHNFPTRLTIGFHQGRATSAESTHIMPGSATKCTQPRHAPSHRCRTRLKTGGAVSFPPRPRHPNSPRTTTPATASTDFYNLPLTPPCPSGHLRRDRRGSDSSTQLSGCSGEFCPTLNVPCS